MKTIRKLAPLLEKKAIDELNENPNKILGYIESFREWILTQPHLNSRIDDEFLLTFLRWAKYSLKRAQDRLDLYYTARSADLNFFTNRNLKNNPRIREVLDYCTAVPLMKTNGEDGPRIIISRPGCFEPSQLHVKEIWKIVGLIADVMFIEDDNALISGVVALVDCANVKPLHLLQYDPNFIKNTAYYFQNCAPSRLKAIHFVNTFPGFETFVNLLKNVLNEKIKSRFFVHGSNMESLYEYIPQNLLPKEYGGETATIRDIVDNWIEKIEKYQDILQEQEKYGVDERKRLNTKTKNESLFGVEGCFKKLDID